MRKAAQKPPRRPPREEKEKRGPRLDPPTPLPPPPRPRAALLLLWPKSGYHPSLFEEDLPGSIHHLRCSRRGSLVVVVKADREVVAFQRAEEEEEGSCRRRPESFKLKKKARVDSLDCQASHLLILSSEGKLYEHNISSGSIKSTPRLLEQLGNKQIIQVTCGDHHSMAFSKGGELFAWGQNEYGQLGINRRGSFFEQPQLVQDLEGIPLANITAGSAHSMALSLSGSVYSWGKNTFGQLGLGDTKDRYRPTYVAAMEHMKTVIISCGGEHTAVLSKDGLVSTFGAGSHGQLGHNSTRNELLPRLVAELFGAHVSQVACGRWHTLVYVPKLGEVYSFGSGAEGQLGNGKNSDQRIPLPLNLTMNGQKIILSVASEEMVKIFAGENQSVVLLLKEKNSYANLNQTLAKVEEEKVEKWVSNSDPNYWKYIQQEIKLIFSSAACINGSFLEKREKYFTTYWKTAGVDMSAVLLFYEKIAAKSKIFKQVIKGLDNLLKSSHSFPDSPEALRVFIIVPFLLRKQDIKSNCLLIQLAEAIANLSEKAKQILECLWSNLEVTFFKDLVGMYQKLVCVKLSAIIKHERCQDTVISQAEFISSAQILQMLYEVNCKAGFRIHESNFYISEVKRILSPPNMSHIRNEEQIGRIILSKTIELQLALGTLVLFPCMFDLEDKIFMQRLSSTFLNMIPFDEMSILHVRRQYLIQDTWQCLRGATERWFLQFLRVHFEGESGFGGGPAQEFFTVIGRKLCAPEVQIFRHFEESNLIWFSSQVPAQEDVYFLIGTLCGMALYNMKIANFPFPLALFKKMANVPLTLEDLTELSPTEGRNLQELLDEPYDDVIERMMLDFTIVEEREGALAMVELKENGANIPVTKYNRREYVDALVNYMFTISVKKQFEDFMRGFKRGCPEETWKMFLPIEFQLVLLGQRQYNWEQLEKNCIYDGYQKSDKIIKDFWAVFHDLPEEKKMKFLAFLTGIDRISAQGMEKFILTITQSEKANPDWCFPQVYTCSKIMRLPNYTNRDILKKMFLRALEQTEEFNLPAP